MSILCYATEGLKLIKERIEMEKVKIIVWGVGRVGSGAVRLLLNKEWIEIAGAIDVAKGKVGKDLGEVVGAGRRLNIAISDDPDAVFSQGKANMVLHMTAGPQEEREAQIMKAIAAGCNVISTAEIRLVYPLVDYRELGERVDEAAKKNGVTVLATGRGPGFMSDLLPIVLTLVCSDVKKITIKRRNIHRWHRDEAPAWGARIGLSVEEFKKRVTDGTLMFPAQVSVQMIADTLGWKLDETRVKVKPITSNKRKGPSPDMQIEPGKTCGWKYVVSGIKEREEVITLDVSAYVDFEGEEVKPESRIIIEGEPNLEMILKGFGTNTGEENSNIVVNYIPVVMEAKPGLVTGRELPVTAPYFIH